MLRALHRVQTVVNASFTSLLRHFAHSGRVTQAFNPPAGACAPMMPYVADRQSVAEADALIAAFGDDAGYEAAARADASRERGNVVMFCRWRQIERLIVVMSIPEATGTIH
jgi:hypothetical protein